MTRVHNFSAGPAGLPEAVIQELGPHLVEFSDAGAGIMEISHRSKQFDDVIQSTEASLRQLLAIPDDYAVLFLQGGASLQFTMAPMNLSSTLDPMGYILSGHWANRAHIEATRLGQSAPILWDGKSSDYQTLPGADTPELSRVGTRWVHYTSNNTIYGSQFHEPPSDSNQLVADMSSDIASRPIDISRHAVIYAGAQKNLGPSGVTLVILSPDAIAASRAKSGLPSMLNYALQADKKSMFNTPNTFGIFALGLVLSWIEAQGGIPEITKRNQLKASRLYAELDASAFWRPQIDPAARSLMNVTWRIADEALESIFVKEAQMQGLVGLKGHRSVGGLRASIYNACPAESVDALIGFMKSFEKQYG